MIVPRTTKTKGEQYDARYYDAEGRLRTKTFDTKTKAKQFLRQIQSEKDQGVFIDPKRRTVLFKQVAEEWLTSNPAKRPGVVGRDRSILNLHVYPRIGLRAIGGLKAGDFQQLVHEWRSKGLSAGTVRRQHAVVRAVMEWAASFDYIAQNPCRSVKLPRAEEPAVHHVITPEQLTELARKLPPRCQPMPFVGAVAGLRWGEVAALRVSDVDERAGTIRVRQSLARDERGSTSVGAPKSHASRRVQSVHPVVISMLVVHARRLGLGQDDLLFAQPNGRPLNYSNFHTRDWVPAVTAMGLPAPSSGRQRHFGFHDLRRAYATQMSLDNVPIHIAARRMGHTDVRLTAAVYPQPVSEADAKAGNRVGAHFLGTGMEDAALLEVAGGE